MYIACNSLLSYIIIVSAVWHGNLSHFFANWFSLSPFRLYSKMTMEVILSTAFGRAVDVQGGKGGKLYEAAIEVFEAFSPDSQNQMSVTRMIQLMLSESTWSTYLHLYLVICFFDFCCNVSWMCFCFCLDVVAFPKFLGPLFQWILANCTGYGKSLDYLSQSALKIVETREKGPSESVVSLRYTVYWALHACWCCDLWMNELCLTRIQISSSFRSVMICNCWPPLFQQVAFYCCQAFV